MGGTAFDGGRPAYNTTDTSVAGPALRVKFSGSTDTDGRPQIAIAGAADFDDIGVSELSGSIGGWAIAAARTTIQAYWKQGTCTFTASGSIAAGADFFRAASGKVSATPNGKRLGVAQEAAADTEIFEGSVDKALSTTGHASMVVSLETASRAVTSADFGKTLVANGVAEVDFTLPAPAAANIGAFVDFANKVDQIMGILPNTVQQDMIANGTAAASLNSVKFQTSSHKIGACGRATQITATLWLFQNLSDCTMTIA